MSLNKMYKEKDYVETLLSQRKVNNTIKSDIKLLAKYYKYVEPEISDEDLKLKIETVLKKKLTNYNEILFYKIINNALDYCNKENNNLVQIASVGITKSEWEYINALPYEDLEKKILFTFIVIDKLKHAKSEIVNVDLGDVHYFGGKSLFGYKTLLDTLQEKITRTYREKGIHKTIKKFNDDGLTRTTYTASIELLFMNDIDPCDEIVFEVNDFDTIGLYYDYYNGNKKVKWCSECNEKLIKVNINNKNNTKYCLHCSHNVRLFRQRNYMQNK